MDRQEFKSSHCQRVHQYLQRHIASNDLDQFSYTGKVEGNPADCLETILKWVVMISIYQVRLLSPPFFYSSNSFTLFLNVVVSPSFLHHSTLSSHLYSYFLTSLFLPCLFPHFLNCPFSFLPFFSAHVVCMTPRGPRFATLSNSWTYSCSLVRHLCFVTGHLLEMSWRVWRDLWSSSWFGCRGYVSKVTLCVPG